MSLPEDSEDFRKWQKTFLEELRKKLDGQPPELRELLYKHKLVKELRTLFQAYMGVMYDIGFGDGKKQGVCLSCNDKGFSVAKTEAFASRAEGFDGYLYKEEKYFSFCTHCTKGKRLARRYVISRIIPQEIGEMLRGEKKDHG